MKRSYRIALIIIAIMAFVVTGCSESEQNGSTDRDVGVEEDADGDGDRDPDGDVETGPHGDMDTGGDADGDTDPGLDPDCEGTTGPEFHRDDFEVIEADPFDYRVLKRELEPGQWLSLEAGEYDILRVNDLHGTADAPIVISGPEEGDGEAVFLRRATNTIQIQNSSHVVIRNLRLDGTTADVGDAIQARQTSHNITLENLLIHDYAPRIGINTSNSAPTWNWTIRNVEIRNASTGMYLGSHGGDNPFVGGLLEYNTIADTTGYNIQIKEQNGRDYEGMPQDPQVTTIRHNRFIRAGVDSARPNLLVGHFPPDGPGSEDQYLIHNNLFFENEHSSENLFQGEGNVALYNNLFVNSEGGGGLNIMPHNDVPRDIYVLRNTFVTAGTAVRINNPNTDHHQRVSGNAAFSNNPFALDANVVEEDNFSRDELQQAESYLVNPFGDLEALDLTPDGDALEKDEIDHGVSFPGLDRDFQCSPRSVHQYGAY